MGAPIWSHNDFLEFLVTGGLILLLAYCALVCWMIAWTWPRTPPSGESSSLRRFRVLAFAGLIAWLCVSFLNGAAFYQSSIGLAVVIGFSYGLRNTVGCTWIDNGIRKGSVGPRRGRRPFRVQPTTTLASDGRPSVSTG